MARKPAAGLPDVFAKPGAAPGRGTPIEDLPQPKAEPIEDTAVLVAEPPPPPPPAPPLARAIEPEPSPEPSQRWVPPDPPPAVQDNETWPDSEQPSAPQAAGGTRVMVVAIAAIVVAVTAPFWEPAIFSVLGIRTPIAQMAERNTLNMTQQDQQVADITQRLTAANAQIAKLQTDLASATQRAQQAVSLTSTMALVRLSSVLRRPVPFAAELAVVQASGANLGEMKPLLDQIEPYAGTGIPGEAQLQQDFTALANQASRGDRGLMPTDWVNNLAVWARLRGPVPPPPAEPSLDMLRQASARIASGELALGVELVRGMDETYRSAFASWIEDARARVAADDLADRVNDLVAKTLHSSAKK